MEEEKNSLAMVKELNTLLGWAGLVLVKTVEILYVT